MSKIKKPSVEGLKKAQEEFNKLRRQKPTPELVKIISEIEVERKDDGHEDSDHTPLKKSAVSKITENSLGV